MKITLENQHRRNLKSETAISVIANAAVSGLFAWGIFHGEATVPLWGANGIVVDLVPTVFMITLALTIALTLVTRGRIRRGKLPVPEWSSHDLGWIGRLPAKVLYRAPVLALLMTLVLVPLSAVVLVAAGVGSMSFPVFFVFKLIYGAAFAVLITPVIILRALADKP